MKLDLFKKLPDVPEELLHPKFLLLRDNIILEGERQILLNWTEDFVDRDYKIVKEFQTTFHSSFWEFYLFSVFKEIGFEIDFSKDRPDFIINHPKVIYIEAVVSNIKLDGRDESTRTADDVSSMIVPPRLQTDFYEVLNEAIVRNSNAIHGKSTKYLDKYINLDWVEETNPFMIALSSYDQVNYGREYFYPLLALLYGQYFRSEEDKYEFKEFVNKPGTTSTIPLGLFNDNSHEHISGIIFSCTMTLGKLTSLSVSAGNSELQQNGVLNIRHDYEPPYYKLQEVSKDNPEYLSDGLFIFHNPFAKRKLDSSDFQRTNAIQVIKTDKGLYFEGENSPLFSRLNLPNFMINDELKKMIILDFNS